MPEQTVQQDGKTYVDIPGIGRYEVPGGPDPNAAIDAPALNRGPIEARIRGFMAGSAEGAKRVLTPETAAGVAALMASPESFGATLPAAARFLIPGGVAGATSIVRDLMQGQTDPMSVAGGAVGHGALNLVPEAIGSVVRGGNAARTAVNAATSGVGGPMGIAAKLMSIIRPSASAAPTAAADFGQYASGPARDALVRKAVEIENQLQAGVAPALRGQLERQLKGLETLIERTKLANQGPLSPTQTLKQTGLPPVRTATDSLADTIMHLLHGGLGGGSIVDQQQQEQTQGAQRRPFQ